MHMSTIECKALIEFKGEFARVGGGILTTYQQFFEYPIHFSKGEYWLEIAQISSMRIELCSVYLHCEAEEASLLAMKFK
ncbi:hypothetical protein A4A49_34432, partial [Nicotiana attenuata]